MGRSLKIGSIHGIDVRLHVTFPLIVLWAAFDWGSRASLGWRGALYGALLVLLLFVCVVLHELGHSLVALRYGVKVKDIILLPIGGVAQMRRMPSKPRQELAVAVAGPAVNLAITLALAALIWAAGHTPAGQDALAYPGRLLRLALFPSLPGVVLYLLLANASMAVFNLLPAFPMDGGRVLRALLAMAMGQARATVVAARTGQVVSLAFLGAGLYLFNPILLLVGFFIFGGAVQELRGAQVRRVLAGITAGQAVGASTAPSLDPEQSLGSVTQLAIFNRERHFPVVRDGELLGLLDVAKLNDAIRDLGPWAPVREAMQVQRVSAQASDSLYEVELLLAENETDSVTINDDRRFLGVLTRQRIGQLYAGGLSARG